MISKAGDAVGAVADKVKGAWPFSPAKWGPFSGAGWYGLPKSGAKIVGQVLSGIEDSVPEAEAAMAGVLNALVPVVPSADIAGSAVGASVFDLADVLSADEGSPDVVAAIDRLIDEIRGARLTGRQVIGGVLA